MTLPEILQSFLPGPIDEQGIKFPDPLAARQSIVKLEKAMAELSEAQIKIATTHRWINGIYAREVFIPKGTLLVGRIHKHPCISIMNKGEKTTITEDGAIRVKAPFATISKAGVKRVGIAHEDTIWTTIHATNERDLKKLEDELFTDNFDDVSSDGSDVFTAVTMEGLCPL
jgi:hypothetical protein